MESQQVINRAFSGDKPELKANEAGKNEMFGYALKFDVPYSMGWFTESISRSAFMNADISDVRVLLNHDPSIILGRTTAGTAQVGIDEVGMWYRATLPDSPNGENVRVALERGDITQSSWAFYTRISESGNGDEWTRVNGKDHRTITDVRAVVDASPVTYPANPDTSAAKRSFDSFYQNDEHEQRTKELELAGAAVEIALT